MARPEGVEPPTLCLEAGGREILNALSSVAYGDCRSEICPQLGYLGYKRPFEIETGEVSPLFSASMSLLAGLAIVVED